jgi:hypothetical protein
MSLSLIPNPTVLSRSHWVQCSGQLLPLPAYYFLQPCCV